MHDHLKLVIAEPAGGAVLAHEQHVEAAIVIEITRNHIWYHERRSHWLSIRSSLECVRSCRCSRRRVSIRHVYFDVMTLASIPFEKPDGALIWTQHEETKAVRARAGGSATRARRLRGFCDLQLMTVNIAHRSDEAVYVLQTQRADVDEALKLESWLCDAT